jgi:superfamily II RNA helicase
VEPDMTKLVMALNNADYLPAIYFVFSRKRCNEYAVAMAPSFSSSAERQEILAHLNDLRSSQPDAIPKELEAPLLNGIASHHAGLLPGVHFPCTLHITAADVF